MAVGQGQIATLPHCHFYSHLLLAIWPIIRHALKYLKRPPDGLSIVPLFRRDRRVASLPRTQSRMAAPRARKNPSSPSAVSRRSDWSSPSRTITIPHSGTTHRRLLLCPTAANVLGGAAGQRRWPSAFFPFTHQLYPYT